MSEFEWPPRMGWCTKHGSTTVCDKCEIERLTAANEALKGEAERAVKSLTTFGFTDWGGEYWKPPIQNVGVFTKLEALNAKYRKALEKLIFQVDIFHGDMDNYPADPPQLNGNAWLRYATLLSVCETSRTALGRE